jgi:hypothetical protein
MVKHPQTRDPAGPNIWPQKNQATKEQTQITLERYSSVVTIDQKRNVEKRPKENICGGVFRSCFLCACQNQLKKA